MVGVLQSMMIKMLKMMKTNVLLVMRHPLSMGLPVHSRLHKVGTEAGPGLSRKSFWGCF